MHNEVRAALAASLLFVVLPALAGGEQPADRCELTGRAILPQEESAPTTVLLLRAESRPNFETPDFARYPELPRRTQTDNQGFFRFESLARAWLYDILIIAPDCRPVSLARFDPGSSPLVTNLAAINPDSAPPRTVLRGRVLDPRGQPVPAALIRIQGVTRNGSTSWPADNIDPFAVSDKAGNFVVYGRTAFAAAEGAIEAEGFAIALFEGWESGDTMHTVTLNEGAALKGRLLRTGDPVAKAEIHLDNFGAEAGSSAWHCSATTDDQGRFLFTHLPPNRGFSLYATMESLGARGALSKQPDRVYGPGSTNDLGDLSLQPAFKVEGRIRLTDGKTLPAHSRLNLVRDLVGFADGLPSVPTPDGAFSFTGIPAENVTVYLRIPGYQISANDRFLKSGSATNLTVRNDIKGLVIQMLPQAGN